MIANFFKKTKPINSFFIGVLFLVYYILFLIYIDTTPFSFLELFKKSGLLLLFLTTFFLVRFINRKNYLSGQSAYVLLFLAMLFGVFPETMNVGNVFISHLALLLGFRRLYSVKSNKLVKQKIFDFGFWVGVASLFYMWSSIFLFLILVAIIKLKKNEIRNFFIPIVGFITPLFLVFMYYFMTNGTDEFFNKLIFEYNIDSLPPTILFSISVLSLLSIIAIIYISIKINTLSHELKPVWIQVVFHLLLAIIVFSVAPIKDNRSLLFLFLPLSIILANFVELIIKKIRKEVIVIGILLISFWRYFL